MWAVWNHVRFAKSSSELPRCRRILLRMRRRRADHAILTPVAAGWSGRRFHPAPCAPAPTHQARDGRRDAPLGRPALRIRRARTRCGCNRKGADMKVTVLITALAGLANATLGPIP